MKADKQNSNKDNISARFSQRLIGKSSPKEINVKILYFRTEVKRDEIPPRLSKNRLLLTSDKEKCKRSYFLREKAVRLTRLII